LKRVLGIDIQTCPACGGTLWIIASVEDPIVIKKILAHLAQKEA
jgi:DNA polymerase II small subunit/DNA polymerase delta subunit B